MSLDRAEGDLVALAPKQLSGTEHFHQGRVEFPLTVGAFWSWAYSNLAANNLRGHLAEFLVASDLGVTDKARIEWDDFDLCTKDSQIKVEVKSAAYLQSWNQSKHSRISFGIAPSVPWNAGAKARVGKAVRNSDVYVFCLLAHKEKSSLDPIDLDQWTFFVLPTSVLNTKLKEQKTLTLGVLEGLEKAKECKRCKYGEIARTIKIALAGH